MDKRTLLAVVLSVIVMVAGFFIISLLTPKAPAPASQTAAVQEPTPTPASSAPAPASGGTQSAAQSAAPGKVVPAAAAGESAASQPIVRETDVYRMTFSRQGAVLTSLQLKNYHNLDGTPVEMLYKSSRGQYPFEIAFGDYQQPATAAGFDLKETAEGDKTIFDFSCIYLSATGVPFTLRKTYVFYRSEYVMELKIGVENSVNDFPVLGTGPYAYTLGIGPQIGPKIIKLDGRTDFRNFVYYESGKRKDMGNQSGNVKELPATQGLTWVGIVGKYFTLIAAPDATPYRYVFDGKKLEDFDRSTLFIQRPAIQAAKVQDTFRIYVGPKTKDVLGRYNEGKSNTVGLEGMKMDEVVTSPALIGWLVPPLNWLLDLFYKLIPNYGIAIILLTLVTKLVFLPLTFKSSESMARMQALNPKVAEVRAKFKDKPERMNQELAELYKREKVNPLGGCLPMLLQLPIFFALYSLLYDNFALRGALFIPGWVPDLSVPDTVITFGGFTVPVLNWTGLHLLPVIMLATQFFYSKFTQTPDTSQQGSGQMKLITYLMPLLMFFLLYETPSGLVLYWTVQNVLSVLQQLYINRVNRRKKAALAAADAGAVSQRRK